MSGRVIEFKVGDLLTENYRPPRWTDRQGESCPLGGCPGPPGMTYARGGR